MKGKDNILADSLTQLKWLGLYEKCPCEENDQDQSIMIFDKGEPIKVTMDPKASVSPDPNMIHTVTDNANPNASQGLDNDTFVLHDVTYVIDNEHPTRPQINLSQEQVKRLQLKDHSLAIIMSKLQKHKVCSTPLLNTYILNDEGLLYWRVREVTNI